MVVSLYQALPSLTAAMRQPFVQSRFSCPVVHCVPSVCKTACMLTLGFLHSLCVAAVCWGDHNINGCDEILNSYGECNPSYLFVAWILCLVKAACCLMGVCVHRRWQLQQAGKPVRNLLVLINPAVILNCLQLFVSVSTSRVYTLADIEPPPPAIVSGISST